MRLGVCPPREFLRMIQRSIWAQGARAGDPLFFSSLYTKTCTRTRSAETADATYGRLPRSRSGRRRAQLLRRTPQPRRHRCGQPLWVTHTHQAGRRRWQGARRMETRWRGAARGDNRAIVASPGSARMPSPTSPCNAPTLPFATVPVGAALETPIHIHDTIPNCRDTVHT